MAGSFFVSPGPQAQIPSPGGGSGPAEGTIPGTEGTANETLELDPDPNARVTITHVGVIHPDGQEDTLIPGVDYEVGGDPTSPSIIFTGIYPPDPEYTVHVHGTTNKPGVVTLTGTWADNLP